MTGSASTNPVLPSALEQTAVIGQKLQAGPLVVFTDYDGTLTPIVAKPELAVLDQSMREALSELAQHCPVGIISGRALTDIQHLVDLDNVYYAGNHGLEVIGPKGSGLSATRGEEFVNDLAEVKQELDNALTDLPGLLIEDKHLSLSVHYRLAPAEKVKHIENAVDHALASHPRLRKHHGKKVFEVRPDIQWHKGYVVNWLLELLALPGAVAIYLGDDVTDEDAFDAVKGQGIGIRIGAPDADSLAHYALRNPEEVRQFLTWLSLQVQGKQ